jgi:ABC-type uncharacterized transport system permease subunit
MDDWLVEYVIKYGRVVVTCINPFILSECLTVTPEALPTTRNSILDVDTGVGIGVVGLVGV